MLIGRFKNNQRKLNMSDLLQTILSLFLIVSAIIGWFLGAIIAWVYYLLYQQTKDQ